MDNSPSLSSEPNDNQSAVERRHSPRFPSDLETQCRSLKDSAAWRAQVLNISRTGLALVLSRRFEKGAVLTMDLENARQDVSRNTLARVVYVRPHDGGTWLLGCVFVNPLDDEELKAFSAKRVPSEDSDPRAWVRFTCDVATFCRPDGDADAEPLPVRVVNIAPSGVALVAADAWQSGTFLRLELPRTAGQSGRSVLLRIVRAEPVAAEWLLGCEFIDQFSEQDLQGLLP
jgi:hypothetical protein